MSRAIEPSTSVVTNPPQSKNKISHLLAKFVECDFQPKPVLWLIPGFIAHGVLVFAGIHGIGKTTVMLPLALVVAGIHKKGDLLAPLHWRHVIYITEDVDQAQLILAGIVGYGNLGVDVQTVKDRFHIVEARRLDIDSVTCVGVIYRKMFTRNVNGVEILPLVVMDTKSAVLEMENENDNSEASRAMADLKQRFAGLPIWLIGHMAKTNLGRSDVSTLSMRGGSAFEADANQVLYIVNEHGTRFLVRGKTRFVAKWDELRIDSFVETAIALDEFGNEEIVSMRWGIATPSDQCRKEIQFENKAKTIRNDEADLRQRVLDLVDTGYLTNLPLNREALKRAIKGRRPEAVLGTVNALISESWLIEVDVPAKERIHQSKKSFLVKLTTVEREALMRDRELPELKLVVPNSWKRPTVQAKSNNEWQVGGIIGDQA